MHSWSGRPPGTKRGGKLPGIRYLTDELANQIKAGLLGEAVEARLTVRQAAPGTSIRDDHVELVLEEIAIGPVETSRLGTPMFDEPGDED